MRAGLSSPVLIGRDDLLALAGRRIAEAADGAGELLFLAGEAGIGKTRLLGALVAQAREAGFAVFAAGAAPGDVDVPAGLLGDIAAALGLSADLLALGDGRQRRLVVGGVAELIADAVTGPTLIAVEDLHWADDLTLDVLGRLGRRARELPLLLVGTYRSDELYPRVPMRVWRTRLLTQRHAEEVRLGRLSLADTATMTAAIGGAAVPEALAEEIFARSDGIPLHVEEFLAAVGRVPDTLADAVLTRAEQLTVPARRLAEVASVLGRSFDLDLLTAMTGDGPDVVDDGLRELTSRFFVEARPGTGDRYDFRHALIRDALYGDVAPHRRRELHARAAATAAEAGFSDAFVGDHYERAGISGPAFSYSIRAARRAAGMSAHREAAELYRRARRTFTAADPLRPYDSPPPASPVPPVPRVSGAPASRSPAPPPDISDLPVTSEADLLVEMAAELAAIDDNAPAAECYADAYRLRLAAGDNVGAAALVPEWVAVRHLLGADLTERAAALRGALPLIAFRDDREAQEVRANLHAALSAAYMLDRRLAEAIEDGQFAQSIAVEDCDRAMRCNIDATLGSVYLFAGRIGEGLELLEGSVSRAAGWGFEAQTARGYRMLGSSASVLVEYDLATRWLTEGIAYAARVEQFNDRHYMAAHLAHVQWATGDWSQAAETARSALADGGGITTRITALHVLGYLALGRGAYPEAVAHLSEAAALGDGMRELQRVSPAWWGLAEAALQAGDESAAIDWCEQGYAASARVHDAAYLFPYVVTGVRAHLPAGAAAAWTWLTKAEELLVERGIPGTMGALVHGRGLIHLHEGRTGLAKDELAEAASFWASRRRFWEGAAVLVDQARCAARSRRPGDAADFLAAAGTAYGKAGRLLPAQPVPPGMSARSDLSDRELEVARLVAAGRTNREIAAELTIAPKTAAAHVEHIRTKLGVSRRAQIAAWVTTNG